jgi:hypothetical protein
LHPYRWPISVLARTACPLRTATFSRGRVLSHEPRFAKPTAKVSSNFGSVWSKTRPVATPSCATRRSRGVFAWFHPETPLPTPASFPASPPPAEFQGPLHRILLRLASNPERFRNGSPSACKMRYSPRFLSHSESYRGAQVSWDEQDLVVRERATGAKRT